MTLHSSTSWPRDSERSACSHSADGILIGRAFVYALAAQGQAGVERLLAIMEKDIRTNMVLTGVTTLRDIGPDVLARKEAGR